MSEPVIRIVPSSEPHYIHTPPPIEPVRRESIPDPILSTPFDPAPPPREKLVGEMNRSEFVDMMVDVLNRPELSRYQQEQLDPGKPRNPVQSVLYTIGSLGHGAVDIAEGVLRGTIDLVTFGNAKR